MITAYELPLNYLVDVMTTVTDFEMEHTLT